MNKIIKLLSHSNIFIYSICISVITFLFKGCIHFVKFVVKIPDIQFREKLVNDHFTISFDLIVNTLILAPIIETIVFQSIFFLIYKYLKINKWIIIISSSLVFGLIHNYSVFYIIDTSLIGFIFMLGYILRSEYNKKPYLSTVVAHFTINLIAVIAIFVKGRFFM